MGVLARCADSESNRFAEKFVRVARAREEMMFPIFNALMKVYAFSTRYGSTPGSLPMVSSLVHVCTVASWNPHRKGVVKSQGVVATHVLIPGMIEGDWYIPGRCRDPYDLERAWSRPWS